MTGRQIRRLLSDGYSLWTVQEALKSLTKLGLTATRTIPARSCLMATAEQRNHAKSFLKRTEEHLVSDDDQPR